MGREEKLITYGTMMNRFSHKYDEEEFYTRLGWDNPNIKIGVQFPDENSKMTKPYLYMVKNGDKFPITLSCESQFAEDWYKVN